MTGHRGVTGGSFDALARSMELVPIEQHGWKGREQTIGDLLLVSAWCFRLQTTQGRAARSENVHGMGRAGQLLEHGFERGRQCAEPSQALLVAFQLPGLWQMAIEEEERDFLECAFFCEVIDGIPAVS